MLTLLLIFRRHLAWIHWAWWHATLRACVAEWTTNMGRALVNRQRRMVTLLMFHRLVREHASHLVYNESSSVKSCLSLWTCSVLFQLMSTAGPLARCSEFNERNDLGVFFFSSFLFSIFFYSCTTLNRTKTSHRWLKNIFISPSQKSSIGVIISME